MNDIYNEHKINFGLNCKEKSNKARVTLQNRYQTGKVKYQSSV